MAVDTNDPFGSVRKLQGVSQGEGMPDWQQGYGQKLQSLRDQFAAKQELTSRVTGLRDAFASMFPAATRAGTSPATRTTRNPDTGQMATGSVAQNRALAQRMAADLGWTGSQWDAFDKLVMKESEYRNTAQNPTSTAFGIGQFLDSTWKGYGAKTSDPRTQLEYMMRYVRDRYGDPSRALQFHLANNWY